MAEASWIVEILKLYGLAGVVIAVQSYAIRKLYNRNQELNDTVAQLGRDSVKANSDTANALLAVAETNRSTGGVVHQLSQMTQQLLWKVGGEK